LYKPTEGEIHFDGMPLSEMNYQSVRNQFGIVLQDPLIFSGSIRQNVAFGLYNYSLETLVEAAKQACLHNEIVQMPMGYETVIAEGGTNLSGGQRQRLALARALARGPSVLLLDEATSHLDVVTESLVDANLSALSCTRIVIAHRLSTIRNADLILVLKDGEIIERGTHEELLAGGGYYSELFRSQAQTKQATIQRERLKVAV